MNVAGLTIRVHWTLAVMTAALLVGVPWMFGRAALYWLLVFLPGALASVLLHEIGHVVVAGLFGIRTRAIVLLPIGGVAQLQANWVPARVDALIALAGPAVSLLLGATLLAGASWGAPMVVWQLGVLNLSVGLFNLAPIFPMDGGRVLRSLLVQRVGLRRGTVIALVVGLVLVIALAAVGAWYWQPEVLLISLFLLAGQRREWVAQAA